MQLDLVYRCLLVLSSPGAVVTMVEGFLTVAMALLGVAGVASGVTVASVTALGSRRVTVVVAVSRGIVRVLLVLRVGRVVLGVHGLLPDLVGRSWSGGGTSSASDDAASNGL